MKIIIAILLFTIIIVIHELGHFLLAKKNGIGVTEFSVGMGPRLVTLVKTKKGFTCKVLASQKYCESREDWKDLTKYSWKIFPIGGSCMMLGEDELLQQENSFNKKGVWARISVIAAGPIFNFILAFVFAMIIIASVGYNPAKVSNVRPGAPGEVAGIKEGDLITSINGKHIDIASDFDVYSQFDLPKEEEVTVAFIREGEKKEITINPNYVQYRLGFSYLSNLEEERAKVDKIEKDWPMEKAGIKSGDLILAVNGQEIANGKQLNEYMTENALSETPVTVTYSRDGVENTVEVTPQRYEGKTLGFSTTVLREKIGPLGVIKYGAIEVRFWITTTVKSIAQMIAGKVKADDIAGPVGIVDMIGTSYEQSKSGGVGIVLLNLCNFVILLSANLGVMNLLPIPALDGGRLVFLFIEAFRRKPINQEKEGIVHLVGLVALMILMVFVMFNDVMRIFR